MRRARRLCQALLATAAVMPWPAAAVDLADSPLFSTLSVPGNLVLALSVEFPTANTPAYFSTSAYVPTTAYLGYFDPDKCYKYVYNKTTPAESYFTPDSLTTNHACTSTSSKPLWSGNYLNWASTQTLDAFRWVLTGGNRGVDDRTQTILVKTFHSGQDDGDYSPNKLLSANIAGATPFKWSAVNTRIWGAGIALWITGTGALDGTASDTSAKAVDYIDHNSYATSGSSVASASTIYELYMRVKVCDSSVGVEANCVKYVDGTTTIYKPEGLMQQYAGKLRYAAFGYLNDADTKRDGGVLRAPMKSIGPKKPNPGSDSVTNAAAEWSATTGIMITNPDSADATATTTSSKNAGKEVAISQSGVMNYLNKFGYASGSYKDRDPVSELYYAALRYLKNQGNVPAYSSLANGGSSMATWLDGFPVVTSWTDPMIYTCQKNFILGIGDVNTHRDANLRGSTLITSNNEPTMPTEVSTDTSVDVPTATDMVGKLEGIAKLGSIYISDNRKDTYFMAGLAYDAHTRDIRPEAEKPGVQTVNTYWLDVLEGQKYAYNNVYYLATKYGGFTVPSDFSPYASTNGTTTLKEDAWHTNADTMEGGGNTNKRPDNYFTANNADAMRSGLTAAFAKISSETGEAFSTAFKPKEPNLPDDKIINYAAAYEASTWTGRVTASLKLANASGASEPGLLWDARALLSDASVSASSRKIITCCTTSSTSPGLPFSAAALATKPLHSRTNYASFSAVPGVSTASQSAANFVNYLRGDTAQERRKGGAYRNRAYLLGDIVNSKVTVVGAPSAAYFNAYNPGYSKFKADNKTRPTVVYVGANDGMMHAFDGSVGEQSSGREMFAYVPSFVYGTSDSAATSGLAALGNPSFSHHYMVDSTPVSADLDLSKTQGATAGAAADWRTLLVGGLGKGGKGYYALDITAPKDWSGEEVLAGKVLWEFTDSRMGYSYGKPLMVKTKKYGWVVVLTSGYGNADGKGYFFFVNPRNGALLGEAVATPEGSTSAPIDLAHATAFIPDLHDFTADALYAGDLQGNLWRLDLTGTTAYSSPTKIAKLTNAASAAQPVSTRVAVEIEPTTKKRTVLFGTGKLLADSDISSSSQQSLYAIVDGYGSFGKFYGSGTSNTALPGTLSFPIPRTKLSQVTDLLVGTTSAGAGWYYDLPVSNGMAQRVNIDPAANRGRVAFAGNLPTGTVCSPAGTGSQYILDFSTGKSVQVDSSGKLIAFSTPVKGMLTDSSFVNTGNKEQTIVGGSSGDVEPTDTEPRPLGAIKQLNWRDVPLAQ